MMTDCNNSVDMRDSSRPTDYINTPDGSKITCVSGYDGNNTVLENGSSSKFSNPHTPIIPLQAVLRGGLLFSRQRNPPSIDVSKTTE